MLDLLKKLVDFFRSPKIRKSMDRVQELVPVALNYAKAVSAATRNASDDAVVRYIENALNQPIAREILSNPNALEGALRAAARALLRKENPQLSDPDRIINAAIELGYIALRDSQ